MSPHSPGNHQSAYPFDFSIHNQERHENLPFLFIVNELDPDKHGQQIELRLDQHDDGHYVFKALTEPISDRNYHLALIFRKGTLNKQVINSLKSKLKSAFATALSLEQVKIEVSQIVQGPETDSWYIGFKEDVSIAPDASGNPWSCSIQLKGIVAEAGVGSRSSQVEMKWANLHLNGSENSISFQKSKHVDIINHQGNGFAPMYFGVHGKNVLLNKEDYSQALKVYFLSNGNVPLALTEKTIIEFSFPFGPNDDDPGCFGEKSHVTNYTLSTQQAQFTSTSETVFYNDKDQSRGYLKLKATFNEPLSRASMNFEFPRIQLSGSDGACTIHIAIRNLPGYWDTPFQVPVIKETSVLDGELRLGRSKTLGTDGRIDFLASGHREGSAFYKVFIQNSYGLNLVGDNRNPIRIKDGDLVLHNKRLAIARGNEKNDGWAHYPQDRPPNEKLNVNGDTYLDGKLEVKEAVNFISSVHVNEGFDCRGTITSGSNIKSWGRIEDKTGFIMPVGSIIAHGAAYNTTSPPKGWLVCNGQRIDRDQYKELRDALGGRSTVPDLRSRFIIGSGQGDGNDARGERLQNYAPNNSGGEQQHQLSASEMPVHSHQFGADDQLADRSQKWGGSKGEAASIDYDATSQGLGYNQAFVCTTSSTGSNQPHNNLPPYYALTYIIKY